MSNKTRKIEIIADEECMKIMAKIATQTNKNSAEVIREALNLYSMVIHERLEHQRGIVFRDLDLASVEDQKFAAGDQGLCKV